MLESGSQPRTHLRITQEGSSRRGAVEMNLTRNHEVAVSNAGLAQRVKDLALP